MKIRVNEKWFEAEEMINCFKAEFENKFGKKVEVFYELNNDAQNSKLFWLTLQDLENTISDIMVSRWPLGLKSRTRKREFVYHKHTFYKLAVDLNRFTLATIGRQLGQDHSTVLHASKTANNLLEAGDKLFCPIYQKIMTAFKNKYGYDGNIQDSFEEESDS